jgi:DNA-3-methyladenine glycosylase
MIDRSLFEADPLTCARSLIGCELVWGETAGIIVETEAYAEHGDPASHAFFRRGTREFIKKNRGGTLYIYLNYGIHWLLNFLAKGKEWNGIILIRALEPTRGAEVMAERRGTSTRGLLCSGPGRLTQAMAIDNRFHGRDIFNLAGAEILERNQTPQIEVDRRIGITKAVDLHWRFLLSGSASVSVPKRKKPAPEPTEAGIKSS